MEKCVHGEIPLYSLPNDVSVRCVLYEEELGDSVELPRALTAAT
jgi:hypothetical protein